MEYSTETGLQLIFFDLASSALLNRVEGVFAGIHLHFDAHGSMNESFASAIPSSNQSFSMFTSPDLCCCAFAHAREEAQGRASVCRRAYNAEGEENLPEE
jgi:hypothetical protein